MYIVSLSKPKEEIKMNVLSTLGIFLGIAYIIFHYKFDDVSKNNPVTSSHSQINKPVMTSGHGLLHQYAMFLVIMNKCILNYRLKTVDRFAIFIKKN